MLQSAVYDAVNQAVEAEMKEGPTGLDNKVQLVDGMGEISEEDESEQPSSVRIEQKRLRPPAPIKVLTKAEKERAELTEMIRGTIKVDP